MNNSIDDICAVIGYSATINLIDFIGGEIIHVPNEDRVDGNDLAVVIGDRALARLSAEWGGQALYIPMPTSREMNRRNMLIADNLMSGRSVESIATECGLSVRRVRMIRRQLERDGYIPRVMHGKRKDSEKAKGPPDA